MIDSSKPPRWRFVAAKLQEVSIVNRYVYFYTQIGKGVSSWARLILVEDQHDFYYERSA
jgi:hypothetical protein